MESKPSGWQDSVWRRPLTEAERAALGQVPELEVEERLTESLAKMPDAPVATNFTARVMDAVDREEAMSTAHWLFRRDWRILLPRVMATAIILIFTGVFWERYELGSQRVTLAKNVAQVASAKPIPSVDALYNFDAIQRMSQPVTADTEVLALMQ
jgi:hypothetical protein